MTRDEERNYVRELARQAMAIASASEMALKRQRWSDAYMLRAPDRVPIWCRPTGCRSELLPEEDLRCTDPLCRPAENQLRWTLICHDLDDDAIVNPYWSVPAAAECEAPPVWGVETKRIPPTAERGSWAFDPAIKDEGDLDKLVMPSWRHNASKTQQRLEQAEELLGDIMPVRVTGRSPLGVGLGAMASQLIGLEGLLLNVAMKPQMVHRLMAVLRDGVMKAMDQVEAMGILTENNDEQIHVSESLKTSPSDVPARFSDLWIWTESQAFGEISPDMWREFLLDYQMPILERYRYVSYGCCENLTRKIDGVLSIPNLRIFVNSPWTDLAVAAEKCRDRACIAWRQKATDVIFADDLTDVRKRLEDGLRITQGLSRVIVLQEVMTTNGNPSRLREWTAMAKRASEELS